MLLIKSSNFLSLVLSVSGTETLKCSEVGRVLQPDETSYSNFDATGLLSSTPTKTTPSDNACVTPFAKTPTCFRSPASKRNGSGRAVFSKSILML